MSYVLGLNAAFHDSAACIVKDGTVIAAAEEERFTGVKHAKRPTPFTAFQLPFHAISYCLKEAGIMLRDVEHVAYSYDPTIEAEPGFNQCRLPFLHPADDYDRNFHAEWRNLFLAEIAAAPRMLIDDVPFHLKKRWEGLSVPGSFMFHFVQHHIAHAASAFLVSPFDSSAVLTLDGRGEAATCLYGLGEGNKISVIKEVHMPHSLGLLYEDATSHLGFLNSSDEYKVMALASSGSPTWLPDLRNAVRYNGDGSFTVDSIDWTAMAGPPREPGSPLTQRDFDLAASVQKVLEETSISMAEWLYGQTNAESLCMAGGVALNCVMNAKIRRAVPFTGFFVQPAANDAGTALGAALWVWNSVLGNQRSFVMKNAYLGPEYSEPEIEAALKRGQLRYTKPHDIARTVAELVSAQKVVAWYQGRMEFGPRALGSRSIVASPQDPAMLHRINALKDREDFRPVAPAVLVERAADYFEDCMDSPFMLFVFDTKPDKRDLIPSAVHVDGSARIQTVSKDQNPLFHQMISEVESITGVPVVINTSFNIRGKPIVCRPEDAIEAFYLSPIDALALGPFLLEK